MAHHWYHDEIKPGDKLTFTREVELHFADLNIPHKLKCGDELVVVERDDDRDYGICITDPRDMTWRAWISIIVAERAQEFWLEMNDMSLDGKRVSRYVPNEDWHREFAALSLEDKIRKWEELRASSFDEM